MKIKTAIRSWKEWYSASHSVFSVRTLDIKLGVWSRGKLTKKVEDVGWKDLHRYLNEELLERNITLGTMKQHLAALSSLFHYLFNEGVVKKNPAAIVKINARALSFAQLEPPEKEPFDAREYSILMAHFKIASGTTYQEKRMLDFWGASVPLAYYCGLRLRDCAMLEYDNFTPNGLVVHTKKRMKRVVLPWKDPVILTKDITDVRKWVSKRHMTTGAWLTKRLKHPANFVFDYPAKAYEDGRSNKLSTAFERLTRKLHITRSDSDKGKTFHMLRHSFVTRLANLGVSLEDIAEKVGHSSIKTTQGYNHTVKTICKSNAP
jgi:integrase